MTDTNEQRLFQDFTSEELQRCESDFNHAQDSLKDLLSALNKSRDPRIKTLLEEKIKLLEKIVRQHKEKQDEALRLALSLSCLTATTQKPKTKTTREAEIKQKIFVAQQAIKNLCAEFGVTQTDLENGIISLQNDEGVKKFKKEVRNIHEGFKDLGFDVHQTKYKGADVFCVVIPPPADRHHYDTNPLTMTARDIDQAMETKKRSPQPSVFKPTQKPSKSSASVSATVIGKGSKIELEKIKSEIIDWFLKEFCSTQERNFSAVAPFAATQRSPIAYP